MDAATVPATYARWVRSVVACAIREARQDAAIRAGAPAPAGHKPLPDSFIDRNAAGDVVVAVIAIPSEEQQLREEEWPTTPATGTQRFPGLRGRTDVRRVSEKQPEIHESRASSSPNSGVKP